jgi:hypothetical protein
MAPQHKEVFNQPSWLLENDAISLAVTKTGGMMAPVTFFRQSEAPFQPYYVNPWHAEDIQVDEGVLGPLRGDFFCMPFGAAGTHNGVEYATHGETASTEWTLSPESSDRELVLTMDTTAPKASVTKRLTLRDGENNVYVQHRVRGGSARTPLGHHQTLEGGDVPQRLLVSTSALRFGRVQSRDAAHYAGGEYYSLEPEARFDDLGAVPTLWLDQPNTDCSAFPNRYGFVDILTVVNDPTVTPAWTAAVDTQARALWFSLKDPAVLPATVFWMENHGRHQSPWLGRNCCIGLEDICGHLADGVAASVEENDLSRDGVPTAIDLSAHDPLVVNVIQGAVRVPEGFGRVASVELRDGKAVFADAAGRTAETAVDHEFIRTGWVE